MTARPRRGGDASPAKADSDGYYVEFQRIGGTVKVSAIDPSTGTEVSTMGPVSAGEEELGRAAVQKLKYVLAKGGGK